MRNILPALCTILFVGGLLTLLFMPMQVALSPANLVDKIEKAVDDSKDPEAALANYYVWEGAKAQWAKDIQARLTQLENKFPTDYRFTLERVRGLKNQAGIEGGTKAAISLLATAATKAITTKKAKEMLAELETAQDDKANGFGQLKTKSAKDWKKIIGALKTQRKSAIKALIIVRP